MKRWNYRPLEEREIARVLERAAFCRLAMVDQGQPYVLPMDYRLERSDGEPVFRLTSPGYGLKMQCLESNRRVSLEFDLSGVSHVDSVVAFGFARFDPPRRPNDSARIKVTAFQVTGRRYYRK